MLHPINTLYWSSNPNYLSKTINKRAAYSLVKSFNVSSSINHDAIAYLIAVPMEHDLDADEEEDDNLDVIYSDPSIAPWLTSLSHD